MPQDLQCQLGCAVEKVRASTIINVSLLQEAITTDDKEEEAKEMNAAKLMFTSPALGNKSSLW